MSDHEDFDTEMTDGALKRPSSPSHSDRSSKSQRTKQGDDEQIIDAMEDSSAQPGSTLSAKAPAFVPSAPTTTTMPKIPVKVEANLYKLIEAGLSDTNINARLASTAARHNLKPYQFTPSQLVLARANHAALKAGTMTAGGASSSSSSSATNLGTTTSTGAKEDGMRPVKPIPAKPLSMRAGAKTYLPEQAKVPKTKEERENSRRLIVVLSKVSMRERPGFSTRLLLLIMTVYINVLCSSLCPFRLWSLLTGLFGNIPIEPTESIGCSTEGYVVEL